MSKLYIIFLLTFSLLNINNVSAEEIVVTIKPIYSLVKRITGDKNNVSLLVDGKNSPHNFELKPSDMKLIGNAKIIFYIDKNFENFIQAALKSADKKLTKVALSKTPNLKLLEFDPSTHHHDHGDHHEHKHEEHSHDKESHDDMTEYDLHIWLSPDNAKMMALYIRDELTKLYPENKKIYADNTEKLIKDIEKSDNNIKSLLTGLSDKNFITFHDAYRYFSNHYRLKNPDAMTINPALSISAKKIKDTRQNLAKNNVVCIFSEPQFDDKIVKVIIEDTKTKLGVLDPIGSSIEKAKLHDAYFIIMEDLAKSMKNCLE